mmetsp:Transcript_13946/g.21744  ORF Transcript_13946/g.21744 Transcript_13946/m.21744 type:complete len:103 (+) Transcript_13946:955-1263(+)
MQGEGLYKWPDGRKYQGAFSNDKKHGFGTYTYSDGRVYKGLWQNGKQHGEGIFISPEGKSRRGEWKEGKRVCWLDKDGGVSQFSNKVSQSMASSKGGFRNII